MRYATLLSALALGLTAAGCNRGSSQPSADSTAPANTPSATAAAMPNAMPNGTPSDTTNAGAWRPLFDGTNTNAWRAYRGTAMPAEGWRVVDKTLVKEGEREDIISRDEFGDFELEWQWKLSPGGNSGMFYRATEADPKVYWTGPEYQMLDDAGHPDGKSRLTSAGAAYALYPAPTGAVKPANEWNSSRLLVRGAHVEHWLNGVKTADYELWSPDWEAKVKASKFGEHPGYGRAKRGHLAIQGDHNGTLTLRDIRIREFQ